MGRRTICENAAGQQFTVKKDYRGRTVATNRETGERIRRDESYNGRTAKWKTTRSGETVAVEDKDYQGRTRINGKRCGYNYKWEYVCK